MKKIANERKPQKQAGQLAEALRQAGYDEETVQRRVKRALDAARSRGAKREARGGQPVCWLSFRDRHLESRADLLAETLRLAGEPEAEVQRRVQRALDRARNRRTKREPAVNRFAGCMSITAAARKLGVRRTELFTWLERSVWLRCTGDGWQATDGALAAGWVAQRGRGAVQWAQLTPAGTQEIARRLGVAVGGASNE